MSESTESKNSTTIQCLDKTLVSNSSDFLGLKPCNSCVCSICHENIFENCIVLVCLHPYHKSCIEKWIFKNKKCPVCRLQVMDDDILLLKMTIEEKLIVTFKKNDLDYCKFIIENYNVDINNSSSWTLLEL